MPGVKGADEIVRAALMGARLGLELSSAAAGENLATLSGTQLQGIRIRGTRGHLNRPANLPQRSSSVFKEPLP